jgi:hypothetical protein
MAYISVDVDLDDIDTDELCNELARRIRSTHFKKGLSAEQKKQLKQDMGQLFRELKIPVDKSISINTLDERMKYEHLVIVFDKYNLSQIQTLLPE